MSRAGYRGGMVFTSGAAGARDPRIDPLHIASRSVVGTYPTYDQAQRAVDYLSDQKFPVERTAIVGSDLKLVEAVTGRLTNGRAIGAGAASGAWFGTFIGLLLGLFSPEGTAFLGALLTGILVGALFGAVFGWLAYRAAGGRRDFTSQKQVVAASYDVVADREVATDAQNLLIKLGWREGP